MQPSSSFTVTAVGGLLRELVTDCKACAAFDPTATPQLQRPPLEAFKALWDTGATASVITQTVVDKCGLKPTGMAVVHGVHGEATVETYLVNLWLPNNVGVQDLKVTLGQIKGADLLIGMDVITNGDFSLTNAGGVTVFSFRIPSLATVDFVKETHTQVAQAQRKADKKQRKANRHKKPWQR